MLRGHRVIIDADLAGLYGVETRVLVQAVNRNRERFPNDFAFQLTREESQRLRSQIVILDAQPQGITSETPGSRQPSGRGKYTKYLPLAFTEQGVAMLSSVLRSARAIEVNIEIMRAFVRLRQLLSEHADLAQKLGELEAKYDAQFSVVFDAIRELMAPASGPAKRIGFQRDESDG
ncbi:MAG TPA: ORF6N domain-containing protein [Polyangiaceae bacterium]|nr:ORF6N domain-containing protein [Polyangiaceae bacterium]